MIPAFISLRSSYQVECSIEVQHLIALSNFKSSIALSQLEKLFAGTLFSSFHLNYLYKRPVLFCFQGGKPTFFSLIGLNEKDVCFRQMVFFKCQPRCAAKNCLHSGGGTQAVCLQLVYKPTYHGIMHLCVLAKFFYYSQLYCSSLV